MAERVSLEQVVARLEALEEQVLGELDPIARKRYLARLEAILVRRGFSPGSSGG